MKEIIQPGKGIGKLRLGMSVREALRLRGKPNSTERIGLSTNKHPKPQLTRDQELLWWEGGTADDPESWLVASIHRERIVQLAAMGVDYRLPSGLSTASEFALIRKTYPKLTVRVGYFGSGDEPGYVGYFFDSLPLGVAFTKGTQDDVGLHNELPKLTPESIVVHPVRQRVLLMEHGLVGLEEKPLGKTSQRIAAWLAGGVIKPL